MDKPKKTKKMTKNETSFTIIIADGFSFKTFLNFLLKFDFKIISLVLSPDKIYIKEKNPSKKIDINVTFDLSKIIYEYESNQKEYIINLDVDYIYKNIKSSLKAKNSLEISKEKKSDSILIGILTSVDLDAKPSSSIFFTSVKRNTIEIFHIIEPKGSFNTYISSLDLTGICKNFIDKNLPILITGFEEAIRFSAKGENSGNIIPKVITRGYFEPDEKEIIQYSMKQKTFKFLELISTFNKQNSIVKFFFEKEKPIKIVFNLSHYSTIKVYIADFTEQVETEVKKSLI